jgi:hypothetical protein
MPNEPEDDPPLLTPKEWTGLVAMALGMVLTFFGTLGISGVFHAMVAVGAALMLIGAGLLGFQARSNTGTR